MTLAEQATYLTDAKGCSVEEAIRQLGIVPDSRIVPGAYIETSWGEAVALTNGPWVSFRYEANRCADNATIWVANSEPCWRVRFVRNGDAHSVSVLALRGAYGDEGA